MTVTIDLELFKEPTQCFLCKNLTDYARKKCKAFKDIPRVILTGKHDHKKPFTGDNGIRFESIVENGKLGQTIRKKGE